jgi:hypothetical protein
MRARDESGVAIVVAILLAALMLSAGLALLSFTDQQTQRTGKERVKEGALGLAEAALNAQANLFSASWPGTPAMAFSGCTQTSTSVNCPDPGNLLRSFSGSDFAGSGAATWSITVRDNGLGGYYDDAATASQPAYDASGPGGVPDSLVWVRAQATLRGERRTVVSLVRASPVGQNFPRGVLTAGHFHTDNNGNKVLIDTGTGPGLLARCDPGAGGPDRGNPCLDYVVTKGQVWPNSWHADPALPNALSSMDVNSLRTRAKAAGTWYSGCPSTIPSAPLVFIESGSCSDTSDTQFNSPSNPGLLVLNEGTLFLAGTTTFYGLIYAVNAGGLTGNVVVLGGDTQVIGAIVVDGAGGMVAGSSKVNIVADPNVFNLVTTTMTITVIANSWRELDGH